MTAFSTCAKEFTLAPVESSVRRKEAPETMHPLATTSGEWQAFIDDVQTTLDKFSVPATEQAEVKAFVESTRAAIVAPAA